jgi:hypothetical protein
MDKEKTLQQIEDIWNYRESVLTNYIQNHELAKQFAESKIILQHTGKEEDIWRINNLARHFNLTHHNSFSFYGPKPIPYDKLYFFVIGPVFDSERNHLIWDIPEYIKKTKQIVNINEIYTKYN